jgi:alpha-tubulin suppressor-like RCC1 family protein
MLTYYDVLSPLLPSPPSLFFCFLSTLPTKLGAGLGVKDYDGLTPLSLINKDRLLMIRKPEVTGVDVYTWGSNANTTLGHAHSRPHPERLELPPHLSISQVVLEKFHSVLLTSSGLVLTCGHGRGGRLGHGTEASFVTPRLVEALKGVKCVSVATARNHTLFLTDCGVVYSCGLNDAHQLGLGSAPNSTPTQCLTPTPITAKNLRGRQITAIGAGRYHSALATESHVYTFGQNLGQLGYERNYHTQIIPKAVPQISVEGDDCIVSLSASHAATAVLTRRHRVFVCCDHIVKSLRCGFLEKLECVQFQLCAPLTDRAHLRGTSPEPTKILLLDSEHKLWYWEPGKKGTLPQLLPGLAQFNGDQYNTLIWCVVSYSHMTDRCAFCDLHFLPFSPCLFLQWLILLSERISPLSQMKERRT